MSQHLMFKAGYTACRAESSALNLGIKSLIRIITKQPATSQKKNGSFVPCRFKGALLLLCAGKE
jgi:hypothetical protein